MTTVRWGRSWEERISLFKVRGGNKTMCLKGKMGVHFPFAHTKDTECLDLIKKEPIWALMAEARKAGHLSDEPVMSGPPEGPHPDKDQRIAWLLEEAALLLRLRDIRRTIRWEYALRLHESLTEKGL